MSTCLFFSVKIPEDKVGPKSLTQVKVLNLSFRSRMRSIRTVVRKGAEQCRPFGSDKKIFKVFPFISLCKTGDP